MIRSRCVFTSDAVNRLQDAQYPGLFAPSESRSAVWPSPFPAILPHLPFVFLITDLLSYLPCTTTTSRFRLGMSVAPALACRFAGSRRRSGWHTLPAALTAGAPTAHRTTNNNFGESLAGLAYVHANVTRFYLAWSLGGWSLC